MKTIPSTRQSSGRSCFLAMCLTLLVGVPFAHGAITLYSDSFESYPVQNPAPNPLTNGPAGGEWVFVDATPPITTNEHSIFSSGGLGAGLNSRAWASATNGAQLTNAISVSSLPPGSAPYTFRLSFVVAADTLTVARSITFNYAITSSSGDLSFVSGRNLDDSQTFAGLSGTGIATSGITGKSNNRRFEFVFQSSAMTTADKITFGITRVTSDNNTAINILLDDVRLAVDDANPPQVQSVQPVLTLQHVRVSFSEPVDPATATDIANYSISGSPLTVQSATLIDPSTVELFTSDQAPDSTHTVQISGVLGQSGVSLVATQLNFTAPSLTISPVRYDAGTTATQPSGPPDPASPEAGNWALSAFTNPGLSVGAVVDDNSTGFNAWNVTDQTTLSGSPNYVIPISQAASSSFAQSNGWRIVVRSRLVDNFGSAAGDQVVLFYNPGVRYGVFWGINVDGNLFVNPITGNTYVVAGGGDAFTYHTTMMIYNPATKAVAVYFDGRLLTDNYTGQSLTGTSLTFGSASTTGKGGMNYNLVQLDVVNATQPMVTLNPQSDTYGVGQKATFTANFSPFVNAFQWLSNGVVIAGATTTNYTTPFITADYNGVQYSLRALSALGNVETAPAILTVSDDTNPPVIVSAQASPLLDRITLTFSEPVLEFYATNIANYSWVNPGVANISAQLTSPLTVELRAGPFVNASNYTVLVSNIRDTSNLIITNNSPATVVFPAVSTLAIYDAGDTTNAPSGPPDPTSAAGGNWTLSIGTNVDLSVSPVPNDLGLGLNAWQIRDATTATAQFASYTQQLATNLQDNARQFGWVLSVRSRIAENFGTPVAIYALYEDYRLDRFGLSFDVNLDNNLVVGVSTTLGFSNIVLTADGSALNDYHLHQIVYNPLTKTGAYYFDNLLIVPSFPVSNPANSVAELAWASRSSAGMGSVNFNLVKFAVVDGPLANLVLNGNNIDVTYRGVLETASQLANPTVWTPVATNLTGTAIYSTPLGNQQFFRSRLP